MPGGRSARGHRDAADARADDHPLQPSSDGRTGAPDGPAGGGRSARPFQPTLSLMLVRNIRRLPSAVASPSISIRAIAGRARTVSATSQINPHPGAAHRRGGPGRERRETTVQRRCAGTGGFSPWHVQFRSIEGARARTRYLVRRMLAPTMADYELIRLPESLFPLYWVIRPFRMLVRRVPRVFRGRSSSSNA